MRCAGGFCAIAAQTLSAIRRYFMSVATSRPLSGVRPAIISTASSGRKSAIRRLTASTPVRSNSLLPTARTLSPSAENTCRNSCARNPSAPSKTARAERTGCAKWCVSMSPHPIGNNEGATRFAAGPSPRSSPRLALRPAEMFEPIGGGFVDLFDRPYRRVAPAVDVFKHDPHTILETHTRFPSELPADQSDVSEGAVWLAGTLGDVYYRPVEEFDQP